MLRKKKALCSPSAAYPSLKENPKGKKAKGQSTIEYIILVAAVVGAILIFSGSFKTAFQSTLNSGTNGMQNMAERLRLSRPQG
jgi:hypothetical protein